MATSLLTSTAAAAFPCLSGGASSRFNPDVGIARNTSYLLPRESNSLQLALPAQQPVAKRKSQSFRCRCSSSGEENLKHGLADNNKNAPNHLYGLKPSQLALFTGENGIFARESRKVTEDSLRYNGFYGDYNGLKNSRSRVSMYGGYRRDSSPPDLPSLALDGRIVYIAMPIMPAVTELILAELIWLMEDDPYKPIHLYICSTGTQDNRGRIVGSETDAYSIIDALSSFRGKIYTINYGGAFGQAALLLALGTKGCRFLMPNCITKLHLPPMYKSSGVISDMYPRAKEHIKLSRLYIAFLSHATGRPYEEIAEFIRIPRYMLPDRAIAFGLADKILQPDDDMFDRKDYDAILGVKRKEERPRGRPGGPQAGPAGQ